ncbi:hypothetical protein BV898_07758 [Hypsibius exemplaris]|uniref:Uncharacterized protein n=1 Tax=Hypsibius exemplaris TaxID=2072580 RepID=A0A1W0WSJ1_HYPEX|nr:hypothetical protein BV898_07758 [Hypsibius exemplaris]
MPAIPRSDAKENDGETSPQWVTEPSPSAATAAGKALNITAFEPSPAEEREIMQSNARRVETFTVKKWPGKLSKSSTTNPQRMAEIGWYCTGPKTAKCYACFKVLEGWVPEDNPKTEHEKHCTDCPLSTISITDTSVLTWRQMIKLDLAIEWRRKKLIAQREWDKVVMLHQQQSDELKGLLAKLQKDTPIHDVTGQESYL